MHRLGHKHIEAALGKDPPVSGLQDQPGGKGVENSVHHALQLPEGLQRQGLLCKLREHAAGGGVENDLGVRMVLCRLNIACIHGAGMPADLDDLPRAQALGHSEGGAAGAAGSQDQDLAPGKIQAKMGNEGPHTAEIRVVSPEPAVPVDDGVHRADGLGCRAQFVQQRDHCLFIGDGHVQAAKGPLFQKGLQLLGRKLAEVVAVVPDGLVDGLGEAMSQVLSNQSVFHTSLPDNPCRNGRSEGPPPPGLSWNPPPPARGG